MVKKIVGEKIIEEDEREVKKFKDYVPKKIIRRRVVSYNRSLFPLGLILAFVFLILSFIYYTSHKVFISGGLWSYVVFSPSFSIISWFYWVLVILIAIIIWQMLD